MTRHATQFSAAYLILKKEGKVLMLRRANTGFQDGKYGLVSGHVEEGETVREAMKKEAKEEAGIDIAVDDMEVVHVVHRKSEGREYFGFYIVVRDWHGTIVNMEPEKCDDLDWFEKDYLPENTIPYIKHVFDAVARGDFFSEYGWEDR